MSPKHSDQYNCRRRALVAVGLFALALGVSSCAGPSIIGNGPALRANLAKPGRIFVMEPLVENRATSHSNIGVDVETIGAIVANRLLAVVRERNPDAEIAASARRTPANLPEYMKAMGGAVLPDERNAASFALQHGAAYLLVPTIVEWREMRTDDPIGAFILPHNRIIIALRLMRLQPPAIVSRVTFRNQSRLTLNQRAKRLLGDDFRKAVLGLLSEGA
jgi:hypothetical protein